MSDDARDTIEIPSRNYFRMALPSDQSVAHRYITLLRPGASVTLYDRASFSLDVGVHGLHYGSNVIAGTGAWKQADGSHAIFGAKAHAHRIVQNMRFLGMQPPSEEQVVEAMRLQAAACVPALTRSDDVYLRTLGLADALELGVGSQSRGMVFVMSRDLTDYLPADGINLLIPGMLLERTSLFSGLPYAKCAANYALGLFWKGQVAKQFGCHEVLHRSPGGGDFSETTGSIPLYLYAPGSKRNPDRDAKPVLLIPHMVSGRLNSITVQVVKQLAHHLRWTVYESPVTHRDIYWATEMAVCGTWSGITPVREIWYQQRFMPDEHGKLGERVILPQEVYNDGIGEMYLAWLQENFMPKCMKRHTSTNFVQELAELYWAVVRQRRSDLRGFDTPTDWHEPVPKAKVVQAKTEL